MTKSTCCYEPLIIQRKLSEPFCLRAICEKCRGVCYGDRTEGEWIQPAPLAVR